MAYFENRIANPEMFENDFGVDALHILERALEPQEESLKYFKMSKETKNERDKNTWWKLCCEYDHKSRGLIMAYEIITCREVINIEPAIHDEIAYVKSIIF